MKNTQVANFVVNTQAEVVSTALNAGKVRLYSGPQPTNAEASLAPANILLCEITLPNIAFGPAVNGVITANPITDALVLADGQVSFFRALQADGTTVVLDGSAGTADANLIIGNTNLVQNAYVSVVAFTHTVLKSATGY